MFLKDVSYAYHLYGRKYSKNRNIVKYYCNISINDIF